MSNENEMVHCPYNFSHLILKPRMAAHLIRCRLQYPCEKFMTCPFNATHDVPEPEFQYHIGNCSDRKAVENFMYVIGDPPKPKEFTELEVPATTENWDKEPVVANSYLDVKNKKLENELLFRQPVGMAKSERKTFWKGESQKFGRATSTGSHSGSNPKDMKSDLMMINETGKKQSLKKEDLIKFISKFSVVKFKSNN